MKTIKTISLISVSPELFEIFDLESFKVSSLINHPWNTNPKYCKLGQDKSGSRESSSAALYKPMLLSDTAENCWLSNKTCWNVERWLPLNIFSIYHFYAFIKLLHCFYFPQFYIVIICRVMCLQVDLSCCNHAFILFTLSVTKILSDKIHM